jgi:malate dehydrogenase (oxaloacetate-decarboxylating)
LAEITNPEGLSGDLAAALKGADVFLGVSVAGAVTKDMVRSMKKGAVIFAMANPVPEIFPDEAKEAGAVVVATGRSDFPNQINNCLGFPGIFRGALDAGAMKITEGMKLAAANALSGLVSERELKADYIIPSAFDERVVLAVAKAVAEAARAEGVCRW